MKRGMETSREEMRLKARPAAPPISETRAASARKIASTSREEKPTAFRMPISFTLCTTLIAVLSKIQSAVIPTLRIEMKARKALSEFTNTPNWATIATGLKTFERGGARARAPSLTACAAEGSFKSRITAW